VSDQLVLLVAVAVLYVPGVLVLVAARAVNPAALLGAAPLLSIALISVSAFAGQVLGVDYEWVCLALVLACLAAATVEVIRRRPDLPRVDAPRVAGPAVALLGVALAVRSWLRGIGGLTTPPQTHDPITHTMITAFIARTGEAGPGAIQATDLLSGEPVRYYPAGFHSFAALLTHVTPDPVVALNAATVVICAVAGPLGIFAVAARLERRATAPAFAGLAALFSALLFRPAVELSHDAGILAFAAGLALLPGFAVCVLDLPRSRHVGRLVVLALAAVALLTVHPSVMFVAVLSAVLLGGCALATGEGRDWLRARAGALALAGIGAAVLAAPWLLAGQALGSQVAAFPLALDPEPVGTVFGRLARFAYGPGFDVELGPFPDRGWDLYQLGFAALFWIGLLGCLTHRRLRPLVVLWAAWAGLYLIWASGGATAPVVGQIAGLFYNSANRLFDLSWVVAPVVAALGVGTLTLLAARWLRARMPWIAGLPGRPLVAVAAVLAAVGYVAGPGGVYAEANQRAVANRWSDPIAVRVSAQDRAAFDYLASVGDDVGRVLNSPNDGSTYLYVYTGLPVVNVYPVGNRETQYGIYLMQYFNQIDDSPEVRCLVRRWDITHVFVSRSAPSISSIGAPDEWTGPEPFKYAPGLADLQDVDALTEVFGNDDARVYRIDPEVARTADLDACSASPSVAPSR